MTKLWSPPGYHDLTPELKKSICNGCGTKGLGGWFVPDTLYGLSIEECCNIHDFMYRVGAIIQDKQEADRTFLNNMLRVVDTGSTWLKPFRKRRAVKYYHAVDLFGGPAFWSGK